MNLKAATVHWLRQTGILEEVKFSYENSSGMMLATSAWLQQIAMWIQIWESDINQEVNKSVGNEWLINNVKS